MSQPRTIALDAMGGDHGPPVVVAGAAISLERHPLLSFLFFGDEARIAAELEKFPALAAKSHVVHTATTIGMSDKPSQALRRGKGTSMWLAIEAVQKGAGGRCRLRRQHRRLHGNFQADPAPHGGYRAPRHRGDLADGQGGMHRARCRRQHRGDRAPALRLCADGRGDGARALPRGAPDESRCSTSVSRRSRATRRCARRTLG